jgi:hypothetical protein
LPIQQNGTKRLVTVWNLATIRVRPMRWNRWFFNFRCFHIHTVNWEKSMQLWKEWRTCSWQENTWHRAWNCMRVSGEPCFRLVLVASAYLEESSKTKRMKTITMSRWPLKLSSMASRRLSTRVKGPRCLMLCSVSRMIR